MRAEGDVGLPEYVGRWYAAVLGEGEGNVVWRVKMYFDVGVEV